MIAANVREAIWMASRGAPAPDDMPPLPQKRKGRSGIVNVEPINVTVVGELIRVNENGIVFGGVDEGAALHHWLQASAEHVATWMGDEWAAQCEGCEHPNLLCKPDEHMVAYGEEFTPVVRPDWAPGLRLQLQLRPKFECAFATHEITASWSLRACRTEGSS